MIEVVAKTRRQLNRLQKQVHTPRGTAARCTPARAQTGPRGRGFARRGLLARLAASAGGDRTPAAASAAAAAAAGGGGWRRVAAAGGGG